MMNIIITLIVLGIVIAVLVWIADHIKGILLGGVPELHFWASVFG